MYYWKCWRNTRLIVFSYLILLIAVSWDVGRRAPMPLGIMSMGIDGWHDFALLFGGLGFGAWILGSTGVGRDIANGKGAYILSGPRPKAFYIWADSAVVFAELVALSCITMAVFTLMLHFGVIYFGLKPEGGYTHITSAHLPLSAVLLVTCTMVLFAGLLFSVTYLLTLLVRRMGAGLLLSAAAFILYIFLRIEVRNLPEPFRLNLPGLIFNPFDFHLPSTQLTLHLLFCIVSCAAVMLAFLYTAKLVVEHIEIRA